MDLWIAREAERRVAAGIAAVALVLPWEFTYVDSAGGILLLRFPLFEIRFVGGVGGFQPIRTPLYLLDRQLAQDIVAVDLVTMYRLWIAGAVLVLLACLLGGALAVSERTTSGPNPTKILGGLLIGAGLAFLGGYGLIMTSGLRGLDVPLGAIIVPLLGAVLVGADRE